MWMRLVMVMLLSCGQLIVRVTLNGVISLYKFWLAKFWLGKFWLKFGAKFWSNSGQNLVEIWFK
jgi:hypothetical protein